MNQYISLITHLKTMTIDTSSGAEVSPLTANKTQPNIRIGTSNTSVESFSWLLGLYCGVVMAIREHSKGLDLSLFY